MKECITAREMIEMAVIVLMKGKKSMVAVRDKEEKLVLKSSSILTQFLNPDYNRNKPIRTKLTRRIADVLTLTFKYYLTCDQEEPMAVFARAVLFIYMISSVDLTMWYSNHEAEFLQLADVVFHAFQGKECMNRSELQKLIYEQAFGTNWHVETAPVTMLYSDYKNIIPGYVSYYKSGEYDELYDLVNDLAREKYFEEQADGTTGFYDWLNSFVLLIDDLLKTDSLEGFKEQYPQLDYQYAPGMSISDVDTDWKKYILEVNFSQLYFHNAMKLLLVELCITNLYHIDHAYLSIFRNSLQCFENNYLSEASSQLPVNVNLIKCQTFQIFKRTLESYTSYLQLQIRVNTELGTFGSCHNQMRFVHQQIPDARSFIGIMVDYLFYGAKNKVGKKTDDENADLDGRIKETQSDTIFKYLSKQQEHFTSVVKDALYLRIAYYLYPEKRVKYGESKLSPDQFIEQLWQLFYYAFGIDFYMLRIDSDTVKEYWCKMLCALFSEIIKDADMSALQRITEKFYVHYQILLADESPIRYTPEEIAFFREQEALAFDDYEQLLQKVTIGAPDRESLSAASKYITDYSDSKIIFFLKKVRETIDYLMKNLKETDSDKLLNRDETYSFPVNSINNWKCIVYTLRTGSQQEQITISDAELNELLYHIRIVSEKSLRDTEMPPIISTLKEELWEFMKSLSDKESTYYFSPFPDSTDKNGKEKQKNSNNLNKQLMDSEPVQQLYSTLRKAYKFLLYRDWMRDHLRFT